MPSLKEIFSEFPFEFSPAPVTDTSITGIAIDNRKVQPGDLFVALRGGSADGHDFIADAIRRGAAAAVGAKGFAGLGAPYIREPDSRPALTHLPAPVYGIPGKN